MTDEERAQIHALVQDLLTYVSSIHLPEEAFDIIDELLVMTEPEELEN